MIIKILIALAVLVVVNGVNSPLVTGYSSREAGLPAAKNKDEG